MIQTYAIFREPIRVDHTRSPKFAETMWQTIVFSSELEIVHRHLNSFRETQVTDAEILLLIWIADLFHHCLELLQPSYLIWMQMLVLGDFDYINLGKTLPRFHSRFTRPLSMIQYCL